MKLRFTILTLLTLLLTIKANAQYQSLFGKTQTSWNEVVHRPFVISTDSLVVTGDTIINSKKYKNCDLYMLPYDEETKHPLENAYFIREDTTQGRAWIINYGFAGPDATEYLIYDLSLQVGDSIDHQSGKIVVDSVYFEDGRKHIRTSHDYQSGMFTPAQTLTFIEGIGTNYGLNGLNNSLALLCSTKDSVQIYQHTLQDSRINGCLFFQMGSSAKLNSQTNKALKLFPNPITKGDFLNFELDIKADLKEVVIISADGQQMKQSIAPQARQISTNGLVPGLYMLKISTRDASYAQRFVISE